MQTKFLKCTLKLYYYPHKIIYLLVLLFKEPCILLLTLLFVYILPCFHLGRKEKEWERKIKKGRGKEWEEGLLWSLLGPLTPYSLWCSCFFFAFCELKPSYGSNS